MPKNPHDRYQVWVPGNSIAKGYHVGTYQQLTEARKAKKSCSEPEVRIWDNQKPNIDGQTGGEVE